MSTSNLVFEEGCFTQPGARCLVLGGTAGQSSEDTPICNPQHCIIDAHCHA